MDGSQSHDEPALVAALLRRLIADQRSGMLAPLAHYEALYPGCEAMVQRVHAQVTGCARDGELAAATHASNSPPVSSSDSKIGRFRIVDELGRGGQAIVYRAEDPTLRRTVALKVLAVGAHLSEKTLRRFRREAEIASRLDHPGICPVFDTGNDGGVTWIAMRCVEGETLARRIAAARRSNGRESVISDSGAPKSPAAPAAATAASSNARGHALRIIAFVEKVARALHAAHEAGVVHRDVKPGNIMVLPDGEPVVLDFGLARTEDAAATAVTQTGDFLGTPSYMAPEQLSGPTELVDRRVDVWGLGVTLYEALTLKRPFEESTRGGLEEAIRSRDPSRVHRENSHVPRDVDAIVEKALEKNPRRRYANTAEFADDLYRVLVHEPVRAKPAGPLLRAQRWVQRNPVPALLIVVLVAGLATALVLLDKIKTRESETQAALRHTRAKALAQTAAEVVQVDPRLALRFALASLDLEPLLPDALSQVHQAVALDHPSVEIRDTGWIHSFVASPDGQQLLTASEDGTARIFDLSDGHELRRFEGHTGGLRSAAWSPDRSLVLTSSGDMSARIFRIDGPPACPPMQHDSPLQTAVFSPDGSRVLTGCDDGYFRVWDLAGRKLVEKKAHAGPTHASFSSDGSRILTYPASLSFQRGFLDFAARLWTAGAEPVGAPMQHREQIQYATFSPGGDRVITCSMDKTAILWDADGNELHKLIGHTGPVMYAAFSHDGDHVVTCSLDRTARVWESADGSHLQTLRGHGHLVWAAAYSPNDDMILTSSIDQQTRLSTPDGYLIDLLRGHKRGEVLAIDFVPQNDGPPRMVSASQEGTVRIWDACSADLPLLSDHHGLAMSAAFSRDGTRVATGGLGVVRLWERNGKLIRELQAGFGTVNAVDFSPDGKQLAAGTWDRRLVIWNLEDGSEPATATLGGPLWGVEFFPDGEMLLVDSLEGPVSLWTPRAKRIRSFTKGPIPVRAALAPDGKSVLTGHDDGVARLWDRDGNPLQAFPGHRGRVSSVSFHPNGSEVLTSGMDGRVIRWDLTGNPLKVMAVPELMANWAAFSPAGDAIASAHTDSSARLWSLDGALIAQLPGHTASIQFLTFSPDGSRLLTAAADGNCRFWFARTSDLLAYAHTLATGELSAEDRRQYADLLGGTSTSESAAIAAEDDAGVCNDAAWTLVEPGSGLARGDPERAATLARRAVELTHGKDPGALQTLGLALCRAGRLAEAVTTLEQADSLRVKAASGRSAVDHAFLAVARHGLGHDDLARADLSAARDLFRATPEEGSAGEAIAEAERALAGGAAPGGGGG